MKTHLSVMTPNAYGGFNTRSLCGRLNKSSTDGMNLTDDKASVTCGFCKKQIAKDEEREQWKARRVAKGRDPLPM